MDGYEATRRILGMDPSEVVIGLTARSSPAEKARIFAVGMTAHITKPYDPDALVRAICTAVEGEGAPDAGAFNLPRDAEGDAEARAHCVDWRTILNEQGNRGDFVDHLVSTALNNYADAPERLRSLIHAGDVDALFSFSHLLKGMMGVLHAPQVRALAGRVETAAQEGRSDTMALAGELAERMAQFIAELRRGRPALD